MELKKTLCLESQFYFKKGYKSKRVKGGDTQGQVWEISKSKVSIIFRVVLPSHHQSVTIYMEYCETGKLTHVLISRAFIEVQLCISELKWIGMGEFNSDDHYIYYCGQESPRRNGVAIIVNKKPQMQFQGTISKTTE